MSVKKRKELEKEIRRQDIIDAAEKLFFSVGFDKTKMEDIAKEAEFTRKTLYAYFTSKDELFLEVYMRGWDSSLKKCYSAINNAKNGLEKLSAFSVAYYEFFSRHSEYFRLMRYWDSVGRNLMEVNPEIMEKFKTQQEDLYKSLLEVFACGKEDGSLRKDLDSKVAIDFFFITLPAIIYRIISNPDLGKKFFLENLEFLLLAFK